MKTTREKEKKRIVGLLNEEGIYSKGLDPLIDNYLDAFIIYKRMFDRWQEEGFPDVKMHQNKAGAINEMKNPLAQQVEVWLDKKNKMLESLGLTNKGKGIAKEGKEKSVEEIDELAAHRMKWREAK